MYLRSAILSALLCGSLLAQQPETLPPPRKAEPVAVKARQSDPIPKPPAPVLAEPELIGASSFDFLAEFKVKNVPSGTALIWDVYPDDTGTALRIIKSEKAAIVKARRPEGGSQAGRSSDAVDGSDPGCWIPSPDGISGQG
jgi:hypothetical protein